MPRFLITAVAAIALTPVANAADICAMPKSDATVASLSWLAGNWIETGKTRVVREHWAGPYGQLLLGVGVTTMGDTAKSFEFFRIAQTTSGVSYFASPNAKPAIEFKAIELCADKVVFENKTHDFPQRVIYRRDANGSLHARIEGTIKGKLEGEDWTYKPER